MVESFWERSVMEQRTPSSVINGRLVHLETSPDDDHPVNLILARLDRITDSLVEDGKSVILVGEARGLTYALHVIFPEYALDEIKWQIMHRRNRRVEEAETSDTAQ